MQQVEVLFEIEVCLVCAFNFKLRAAKFSGVIPKLHSFESSTGTVEKIPVLRIQGEG